MNSHHVSSYANVKLLFLAALFVLFGTALGVNSDNGVSVTDDLLRVQLAEVESVDGDSERLDDGIAHDVIVGNHFFFYAGISGRLAVLSNKVNIPLHLSFQARPRAPPLV